MDYIEIDEITPESIIVFANNGIRSFKAVENNPDVQYGEVIDWMLKYSNVSDYIFRLKKQSNQRVNKLHLKRTKTDVISLYRNNADIFEEFIKTKHSSVRLSHKLMGLEDDNGLVQVKRSGYFLIPFTQDVHMLLIREGRTFITNIGETNRDKDRKLNLRNIKTQKYMIMASYYVDIHDINVPIPEDDLPEIPPEFFGIGSNPLRPKVFGMKQPCSIKAKWIRHLYHSRGVSKFYLLHPMETAENHQLYQKIKSTQSIRRYR